MTTPDRRKGRLSAITRTEPVVWIDPPAELLWRQSRESSPAAAGMFVVGIAGLLLTNGIVAIVEPQTFRSILDANAVARHWPTWIVEAAVTAAGCHDVALAAAVIATRLRVDWVRIWLGAWFVVIAVTKAMNLVI